MAQDHAALRDGHAETDCGLESLRVAQGGIHSCRHMANFSLAHSIDVLRGKLGTREANASLRGVSEGRKCIVEGQRVGYEKQVLDGPGAARTTDEELRRREEELTAELEAIRERRGA